MNALTVKAGRGVVDLGLLSRLYVLSFIDRLILALLVHACEAAAHRAFRAFGDCYGRSSGRLHRIGRP